MPDEYEMFLIMREMGWDYDTYLKQPDNLIILIQEFIKINNDSN